MVKRLRNWLFRLCFGFDPKNLLRLSSRIRDLEEKIVTLESQIHITSKVLIEIADQTGGYGWTETVQNAIYSLHHQISELETEISAHAEMYKRFIEEVDEIELEVPISNKKDIN
jgi:hypothetical protein